MFDTIDPATIHQLARGLEAAEPGAVHALLTAFLLQNASVVEVTRDETWRGYEFTVSHTVIVDDEVAFCALQSAVNKTCRWSNRFD